MWVFTLISLSAILFSFCLYQSILNHVGYPDERSQATANKLSIVLLYFFYFVVLAQLFGDKVLTSERNISLVIYFLFVLINYVVWKKKDKL